MSLLKISGLSLLWCCHCLFAQDEISKERNVVIGDGDGFEALVNDYFDESARLSPVWATGIGDHRYDASIDDVSEQGRERRRHLQLDLLQRIEILSRGRLSRAEKVDIAILRHHLKTSVWRHDILQEWAWNPLRYSGLAGDAVYGLMAREFAPLSDRLRSATSRLLQLPALFEQARSVLIPSRVPRAHAETAVGQNRGILAIIKNTIQPHRSALKPKDRRDLTGAIEVARQAVEEHQQWLENHLLPKAAGNYRLGATLYDQKLEQTLQSPLTRQQIKERGKQQIRALHDRMFEIARNVYLKRFPYTQFPRRPSRAYKKSIIRACLELACQDRPSAEGVVTAANESVRLTRQFLSENDIVTLPEDPMEIIVMPEFRRGVSLAYCDSPGPLEKGLKTFYAVSPPPASWTEEQVASHLREYNRRSLHNLTIHEAMPGHFVQLAHANRTPRRIRSVLGSGTFIEGWAVYSEWMMCEEGFLKDDPLMRLVVLKWYLRDVTNALLDQAIHVDGIEKQEAMRLMMEDAFQEEREADGKWRRAQLTSAQLSTYFVGYLEHVDLRSEVEAEWGGHFVLKEYHDQLLSFGSIATKYVRALMLGSRIPKG
ncbi:MAG: DUF885 domain-containing protein [Limisphaerales bacterium]|nr:DUF885 domain-containing protein [Verrucomicrobiales bacterium]|tara:strand:+ start:1586 stop:3382 length:1797 start_codon:yes stop_codon:yes gene_type:complete